MQSGFTSGLPSRSPPIQEPNCTRFGKIGLVEFESVNVAKRFDDFGVNSRQRVEQRQTKIAKAHADFVVDGRLGEANFVGLPERRDFGADLFSQSSASSAVSGRRSSRSSCLRDAPPFQQNSLRAQLPWDAR